MRIGDRIDGFHRPAENEEDDHQEHESGKRHHQCRETRNHDQSAGEEQHDAAIEPV
ncbi:hypothetical protein D3C71_1898870 [compost metagenome]